MEEIGLVNQDVEGGRHSREPSRPQGLHRLDHLARKGEAVLEDYRPSHCQMSQEHGVAKRVEKGQHIHDAVFAREAKILDYRAGIRRQVAVREHSPLRAAGGTRRIEHHGRRRRFRRRPVKRRSAEHSGILLERRCQEDDLRRLDPLLQARQNLVATDEDPRAAVAQDPVEVRRRGLRIDWNGDGSGRENPKQSDHVLE